VNRLGLAAPRATDILDREPPRPGVDGLGNDALAIFLAVASKASTDLESPDPIQFDALIELSRGAAKNHRRRFATDPNVIETHDDAPSHYQ
jgi:hypothetical protein